MIYFENQFIMVDYNESIEISKCKSYKNTFYVLPEIRGVQKNNDTGFLFTKVFFSPEIDVNLFKIVPLSRYKPMETFPLLVAALEVFNRYVRYTLLDVF